MVEPGSEFTTGASGPIEEFRVSTLFEDEVRRFSELLENDRELAYRRFGFTMLYGLSDEQLVRERDRLDLSEKQPTDYYNLGVVANQEERHEDAVELYNQAIEAGCELPELRFNLALSHEVLGDTNKAKQYYEAYAELLRPKSETDDEAREELGRIEARLAEL